VGLCSTGVVCSIAVSIVGTCSRVRRGTYKAINNSLKTLTEMLHAAAHSGLGEAASNHTDPQTNSDEEHLEQVTGAHYGRLFQAFGSNRIGKNQPSCYWIALSETESRPRNCLPKMCWMRDAAGDATPLLGNC